MAANPALMTAAREALKTVLRLAGPTLADDLYIDLQPLIILHGPPDFGQDEAGAGLQKAWFDLYVSALKGHPREAIQIAVSECIRLRKYPDFPLPGYLNELAQEASDEIKLLAFRLRMAVERADRHRPPPPRTPEDALKVKAMVEEMKGPDGKIHIAKTTSDVLPPTDRVATAQALRNLADYK